LCFGLDALFTQNVAAYFGRTPPPAERSISSEQEAWINSAKPTDKVSDGVRAFAGVLLQIYAGDPSVILIDEPETFLHPALAHRMGRELAKGAVDQKKHVFAADPVRNNLVPTVYPFKCINGVPTALSRTSPPRASKRCIG
jgi:hypothetical protein